MTPDRNTRRHTLRSVHSSPGRPFFFLIEKVLWYEAGRCSTNAHIMQQTRLLLALAHSQLTPSSRSPGKYFHKQKEGGCGRARGEKIHRRLEKQFKALPSWQKCPPQPPRPSPNCPKLKSMNDKVGGYIFQASAP